MTAVVDFLGHLRFYVAGALAFLLAVLTSGHAIMYKRDSRSAVGWVGLIWLAPVVGSLLYVVFGINRIRRRAALLRAVGPRLSGPLLALRPGDALVAQHLPPEAHHLQAVARAVDGITLRRLTSGNDLEPLANGDEAYPRMLEAIGKAKHSIALATYIFDNDAVGRQFADALARAMRRGVEVRVLIDGVGARYSWPPIIHSLAKRGLQVARFMPTVVPWRAPFMNLRNHRKILVTDGTLGFTGGMNIRRGHVLGAEPSRPVQDVQFRVRGPVVRHLIETFAEDWAFTTREVLEGPLWFPEIAEAGTIVARGIPDGPDEDFEKLRWTILAALASARSSIRVLTPYFLPDSALVTALNVAAMRGVHVDIILPQKNNQFLVQWASSASVWQVVKRGCRVFLSPPPFDHSKLVVIDDAWTLIGSGNWDPRSLRLNFEFNLECYDAEFGAWMGAWFDGKRARARELTSRELDARSLPVQLRDGVARLVSPYL